MRTIIASVLVTLVTVSALQAQEFEFPKPVKEHEWLNQFAGEWETESEMTAGPGQPAIKCKGTMNSRLLGGFWAISDYKGEMMGMTMTAVQTIGYDTDKKKYVGTWVDNMMNHMWKYEGTIDSTGKKITLEAEGPDFTSPGKKALFRDAYEFKSKDHIIMTSSMRDADGKWVTFVTGDIRRKKGN